VQITINGPRWFWILEWKACSPLTTLQILYILQSSLFRGFSTKNFDHSWLLDNSYEINQGSFYWTWFLRSDFASAPLWLSQRHQPSWDFLTNSSLQKQSCAHFLRKPSNTSRYLILLTLCTFLQQHSFNSPLGWWVLSFQLACTHLAWLLCLTCTFVGMRTTISLLSF